MRLLLGARSRADSPLRTQAWLQRGSLRPGFMEFAMLGALVVSLTCGLVATLSPDAALKREVLDRQAEALIRHDLASLGWEPVASGDAERLRELEGIELMTATRSFHLGHSPGAIVGEPPAQAGLEIAVRVLIDELRRYPARSLAAARFRRVLLCRRLAEEASPIPSLPNYRQTMLLDVESSPAFLRRLIHHELFHFVDYADDDQVQRDPAWAALNDRFFTYGSGGRSMRKPESSRLTHLRPGFLSEYATSAIEEDKAEVYSFMMTAPDVVQRIARRDAVVRRKVAAIRRQVGAVLPGVTAEFWAELEAGRR